MLANCRSQFLLDRLGRCITLFVSTVTISRLNSAKDFLYAKNTKNNRKVRVSRKCLLNEQASDRSKTGAKPVTSDNMSSDNSDHSGDRLSQNDEKQQVKTETTRVYTFKAWQMWFSIYYVAYAFV